MRLKPRQQVGPTVGRPIVGGLAICGLLACGLLACGVAAADEEGMASDRPLRVVIAAGPGKQPLTTFQKYLEAHFPVRCRWVEAERARKEKRTERHVPTPFQGLEVLDDADVILSNLYRTWAPPDELATLQKHFRAKPVVGLRKSHHGFQNWLEADRELFGVEYGSHYYGKNVTQRFAEAGARHPLVAGLELSLPAGGLYVHTGVAPDVEVLVEGGPESKPAHPQTWLRVDRETGRRVFYTRYDPEDLQREDVRAMVVRALFWAAGRELPAER